MYKKKKRYKDHLPLLRCLNRLSSVLFSFWKKKKNLELFLSKHNEEQKKKNQRDVEYHIRFPDQQGKGGRRSVSLKHQ